MAKIPERRAANKAVSTFTWQSIVLCQAFALGISPLVPLSAMAQTAGSTGTTTAPVTSSPQTVGGTTILPTDVVPLADREAYKTPIGELLQLKIMQRLPSNLYFSSSVEVTGRDETNPFQFPLKRTLLSQLPGPAIWRTLNANEQSSLYNILGQVARNNAIFRVLPNVSGGWAFTPHTRLFTNYFMIRDQLTHSMRLNTVIHSYAIGLQHDWALGSKGSIQAEMQGRELWQLHQQSVFDFLPGVTLSYIATPRTVLFVNALMQIRAKSVFLANDSMKEIDPFYTWGGLYQKNGWTFSASSTFVQNFRQPFHHAATIPKNSYVLISDFEIARRILKQYPGLQAFMRAEPIWNFHSHSTPSLSGMDFRMFFGMRFAMAKPPLTATLQQIREQLKQETVPEGPTTKPSAELPVEPEIALNPQPIHGFIESSTLAETCQLPEGEMPVIAEDDSSEEAASNNMIAQEPAPNQPDAGAPVMNTNELADANSAADALASESKEDLAKPAPATAIASVEAEKEPATVADAALKELSDKTEKDYKLAFSSLPAPLPLSPSPVLAPQATGLKAMSAVPLAAPLAVAPLSPSGKSPVGAAKGSAVFASKPVPAPAVANANQTMSFIYVPPKPMLPKMDSAAANKLMQPLQQKSAHSHAAELPLAAMKSEKKGTIASPVPMLSKMQSVAPNTVPAPVSAKLPKPLGILPSVSGEKASTDSSVAAGTTAPVHHVTNKDGSIAVSEAKMDTFESSNTKSVATKTPPAVAKSAESTQKIASLPAANTPKIASLPVASSPKIATPPAESSQIAQPADNTHQNSARENEMLLASNKITKLVSNNPFRTQANPLSLPVIRSTPVPQTISTVSNSSNTKAPQLSLKTPVIPVAPAEIPDGQNNPMAVSGLSEEEISSSPKIAMAVYDSWQSPVMDDPLIEDSSAKAHKSVHTPYESSAVSAQQKHKQPEKKRTDMKLIPPFPTTSRESKDSPLKDLKIPVLPVR